MWRSEFHEPADLVCQPGQEIISYAFCHGQVHQGAGAGRCPRRECVPVDGRRGLQLIRYSAEKGLDRLMAWLVEGGADLTLDSGQVVYGSQAVVECLDAMNKTGKPLALFTTLW